MQSPTLLLACLCTCVLFHMCACADSKRPFYVIGHMVNSIRQVTHYLDRGANALESDIQFHPSGMVREVYHGFPCDCFRTCSYRVQLSEYLQHVREVTDPQLQGGYHKRMLLQMFDLKLDKVANRTLAGRDLARHILDYLWTNGTRDQEVRAVVYISTVDHKDAIHGLLDVFRERGRTDRLRDVAFDAGAGDIYDMVMAITGLPTAVNSWAGDGQTNCISYFYPDYRLRQELAVRDSGRTPFAKVYHWTIDLKIRMRLSLNLGVDAMITNDPDDLVEVLQEEYFSPDYRLATIEDDPFARHEPAGDGS